MVVARSSRIFLASVRINDLSQRAVTKLFGVGGLGPPTSLTVPTVTSQSHPIVLTSAVIHRIHSFILKFFSTKRGKQMGK